jgi:hypothetical protein
MKLADNRELMHPSNVIFGLNHIHYEVKL